MKMEKFISQKYLSAAKNKDIDGKIFVIDSVFTEVINGVDKVVMRFKGLDKTLVLNKTNMNALVAAYGDESDTWINNKVQLIIIWTTYQGNPTEGIQIKAIK